MKTRPNILVIHTDQQNSWTLGVYGGTLIRTPNIDRIGREGAIATNFFVTSAVCTPSRGCMLTGRYPHQHGAYRNPVPLNRDEVTLAHVLASHGYETGYIGKWHLDGHDHPAHDWIPRDRSMGFEDCRFMQNRGHPKSVIDNGNGTFDFSQDVGLGAYPTGWFTDRAIDFIARPRQRPFFLVLSIPDPHQPYSVCEPYAHMFRSDEMPIPASFWDRNHPSWVETAPVAAGSSWGKPNREATLRERKAAYCGMVKCIDDNVGRLLDALDEHGILNDTLVIFTTDHGDYMGEHGLYGKNMVYETAYRVPLLLRWPGTIAPGTVVERIIGMVDFQQTVLGLLGLPASGREQGRDASPFFRGQDAEWTDEAFIHHSRFGYSGIFTPEFELGLARCGEHVLFNRRNDPEQIHNLIDDPAHEDIKYELAERVVRHNRDLDSPAMEWLGDWERTDREQPRDTDTSLAAMDWWLKNRKAATTT